ncbi:Dipeptide transport system permease protein DppC [Leucobacter aridicollis]|uniref:ABC transporter permease n=1 Tax=Leucobacter aridicollis TaxID=283878 RepID=UPI000EAFA2C6|nr:ABC transporter permease [Leucobacter aridicollis]MCS3426510.1 peptide/nickel transport system permease protein [Leucobacter aridicollis]RKQ89339.1 peptide/nickel transport system permease protein [Mycolicibacterium mucogenicum 261Sha1.1M5]
MNRIAAPKTQVVQVSRPIPAGFFALFWQSTPARFGLIAFSAIVLLVIVGPFALPFTPEQIDLSAKGQAPSLAHLMGTDELGRDVLARVLDGGRLTILVAVIAVGVAITLGILVGAIAGYFGGWIDNLLMRIADVFYSMPALFVVILLVALIGPGFGSIILAISAFSWMTTARLLRASILSLKKSDFVQAARGLGATDLRLIVVHILPNALAPIFVAATLGIASAVLTESALSFLGLGFQAPQATWGGLLEEAQRAVISGGQWWRGLFPGIMIFLVILSVNFIGEGLNKAIQGRKEHTS